jgi:chemotaxis protein methyltransferase CheR
MAVVPVNRRFLADRMLTRLTRWLRVAGEDVLAPARPGSHEPPRDELLRLARSENRIVLTRDQSFPGLRSERLLILATELEPQLIEFYRAFPADPLEHAFQRCSACNGLAAVVERRDVLDEVPLAVRERGTGFRRCVQCGHVYWEGSHSRHIREKLLAVRREMEANASPPPALLPDDQRGWARFDDFLRELLIRLDLSWAGYRRPRRSLRGPVVAQMRELGIIDYARYLDYIEQHFEEEEKRLAAILTVPISRFFRDREDWRQLAQVAFPALGARGGIVRAASLGCASGEEPYTLRLLWDQHQLGELAIEAFDLREDLLARAARAVYTPSSLHSVPSAIREQSFVQHGPTFQLDRRVVESVRFVRGDFLREPLPGPFDLILCRNSAFTYLGEDRRLRALAILAGALVPGGFLMIGGGERLPEGQRGRPFQRVGRCLYRQT